MACASNPKCLHLFAPSLHDAVSKWYEEVAQPSERLLFRKLVWKIMSTTSFVSETETSNLSSFLCDEKFQLWGSTIINSQFKSAFLTWAKEGIPCELHQWKKFMGSLAGKTSSAPIPSRYQSAGVLPGLKNSKPSNKNPLATQDEISRVTQARTKKQPHLSLEKQTPYARSCSVALPASTTVEHFQSPSTEMLTENIQQMHSRHSHALRPVECPPYAKLAKLPSNWRSVTKEQFQPISLEDQTKAHEWHPDHFPSHPKNEGMKRMMIAPRV